MIFAFLLLALGLLMIFIEFYLPGGVMGAIGGLVVLSSVVLFVVKSDSALLVVLYIIGVVAALILLFRFALWRIQHAPPDRSIYSAGDQEGYIASSYDKGAIGKEGVVATDLRPGGHVVIEGKKHSAISVSGYLPKGEKIKVIDGQGESLMVKKI